MRLKSRSGVAHLAAVIPAAVCVCLVAACLPVMADAPTAATYNEQGVDLEAGQHYVTAVPYFRFAIAMDPKFEPAHRNLSEALYQCGDMAGAEQEAYTATTLNPIDAYAWRNLARPLAQQGRFVDALRMMESAQKLAPSDAVIADNLGSILYQYGRMRDAMVELNYSAKLQPHYGPTHNDLGLVHLALRDYSAAIDEFRLALKCAPSYGVAHWNLACALNDTGKSTEARTEWKLAAKSGDPVVAAWIKSMNGGASGGSSTQQDKGPILDKDWAPADRGNPRLIPLPGMPF